MFKVENIKTKKIYSATGVSSLEIMVVGGILSIVGLITVGTIFNNAQNSAAIISYQGAMKKIRTAIYSCESKNARILFSGSEGAAICGGEEKFPALSDRCNHLTPSYRIKRTDHSWELTTVRTDNKDELWYCQGCSVTCTADECVYTERENGACQNIE